MCWTDPAVAARTAVHVAASVRVGVGARVTTTALGHAVDADGDLLMALSNRQVATLAMFLSDRRPTDPVPATAVAIDLAPVAIADRVRRTVTLHGPMVALDGAARTSARRLVRAREAHTDPLVWDGDARVLRLEPTAMTTSETCLCVGMPGYPVEREVDVEEYLTAQPDPLVDVEADWLCHLAVDHQQTLTLLALHSAPWLDGSSLEVMPLAVDRTGLRLRTRTNDGWRDVRLAFDQPVACPCGANEAINELFVRASVAP